MKTSTGGASQWERGSKCKMIALTAVSSAFPFGRDACPPPRGHLFQMKHLFLYFLEKKKKIGALKIHLSKCADASEPRRGAVGNKIRREASYIEILMPLFRLYYTPVSPRRLPAVSQLCPAPWLTVPDSDWTDGCVSAALFVNLFI